VGALKNFPFKFLKSPGPNLKIKRSLLKKIPSLLNLGKTLFKKTPL